MLLSSASDYPSRTCRAGGHLHRLASPRMLRGKQADGFFADRITSRRPSRGLTLPLAVRSTPLRVVPDRSRTVLMVREGELMLHRTPLRTAPEPGAEACRPPWVKASVARHASERGVCGGIRGWIIIPPNRY